MAWDIQIESETGDIVFTPAHDIAGVGGEGLLRQRVSMRCKVPRGTYMYDTDGDFGSTLHQHSGTYSSHDQAQAVQESVRQALEPMRDEITVRDVKVSVTENNQLQVDVVFSAISTDPDVPTLDPSNDPQFDAIAVTIPQD